MLYSTDKKHALIFAYAVIGCLLVFVVTSKARIRDSVSDPYGSIITAHAILKHHTMKLNAFESEIKMSHHGIVKLGENIYDEYPPGTAFMSLPAVYIADLLGRDLLSTGGITKTQVNIISIVNPAIFLIIFLIGTFYVPPTESFIVTAVSFFGSSLSSSLSTALWNLNFEVLLITFCLLLLAAHDRGRLSSPKPYLLGVLLALAFACRPTAALFILACFLYLYLTDIRALLKTAAASFAGLVVFMAFSLYTYGMILPPYYFTKASGGSIPTAFYGVLLSPSRGLLIFSPFIALVLIYAFALRKQLKGFKIFWLVLSWPVLHIALVSNTSFWWGGNCFGSRLLTDSLPAYILLTFLILRVMNEKGMDLKKPLTVFLAAGALAIWINTYQGLFNKWTAHWNGNPYVNEEHALDWRYPQFLMNGQRLKERVLEHLGRDKYWIYVDEDNHTLSIVPYQKR